tara:strand:- start:52 stop:330 length:279 start_codon:yes stop_codon:yes gene_type:complete
MDIKFKDEKESENISLEETVQPDTELKNWLVEHVGEKQSPEDGLVTVGMVVETIADEFPELVLALAEENWVRGYQQAFYDLRGDLENEQQPT